MKLFYGIVFVMMLFVSACAPQAPEPEAQPSAPPAPAPTPPSPPEVVAPPVEEVAEPSTTEVRYGATGFDTAEVAISVGDTVTFFNDESKTIVATPRISPEGQADVEFTDPGEFNFWLNLAYAPQGGVITVEGSAIEETS